VCTGFSLLFKAMIVGKTPMYNCVLWSGANLPLPKMEGKRPQRSQSWDPLFASPHEVPLYWWLLLDHFNCFWLEDGTPIFVVDRASALARADARFSKVEEFILPRQSDAWQAFRQALQACPGDILTIQVAGLWQQSFLANAERFNAYLKNCLLPLEGGVSGTRSQKEQKRQLISELFASIGFEAQALRGEALSAGALRLEGAAASRRHRLS
jgi:hypothetical protein